MPTTIQTHDAIEPARDALLHELESWLQDVVKKHRGTKWKGIHDEGTFLTSFREYHALSGDATVEHLVRDRFNASEAWWNKHGKDGYHKLQEVHHGTEHFIIFLAWLRETGMGEQEALNTRLRNAANHIVIKGKKRRAWYDPSTNRFASTHLGTKFIGNDGLNIVEHLRLVRMAWLGFRAGGDTRLKPFVVDYATEWARATVEEQEIPVFLDADESQGKKNMYMKALSTFIGAAPKNLTPEARSEVHVANGTPSLFMALHDATGDRVFLDAAERVVSGLERQLWSPYANPAGNLLANLVNRGRKGTVKETMEKIVQEIRSVKDCTVTLQDGVNWKDPEYKVYANTVGMRPDLPAIVMRTPGGETIQVPCPGTLALAYKLLGDETCMVQALDGAAALLKEARGRYTDGREHGCGSKTIAAACIGNGRAWGAGHVSVALRGIMDPVDAGIVLPDTI